MPRDVNAPPATRPRVGAGRRLRRALPLGLRLRCGLTEAGRRTGAIAWRTSRGARWLTRRDLLRRARSDERPTEPSIRMWERKVWSQNGEDGIIDGLLTSIGAPTRFTVEIGASDGSENCTRHLLEDPAWSGLWLEGDPARVEVASSLRRPGLQVEAALVTAENVVDLLDAADVPEEFDLLVIDIDGNDLWVWEAVNCRYRPRVLVLEYNGSFPPPSRWIARYEPDRGWDGSRRYGASLSALHDVAVRRGYVLVGCDSMGVNSFWVRADLAAPVRHLVGTPREHYVRPRHVRGALGHPRGPESRRPMPALALDAAAQITVDTFELTHPAPVAGAAVYALATISNRSGHTITSSAPHPVHAALRWYNADGLRVGPEPARSELTRPVRPGQRATVGLESSAPCTPGAYDLEATLVQEDVRWWPEAASSRRRVEVRGQPKT